ncbi:Methionyl-tRNA formyltransferase [hydrothermal vent metagenome]|uniref:methionyl-tRNA formyltransferase n=1 Tax=hydrothermal vent metagenome TaxID=652676 RepID=A0A3B1CDZ6_9ZZZZ
MIKQLKVVFMGTPDFATPTLRALIEHPAFSVEAVVTQPDKPKGRGKRLMPTPVKQVAIEHKIPVFQPIKAREPKNVEALTKIKPDYIVVVAYGQILPLSMLEIPQIAPVNLHASLLPIWRGAAPINRAIIAGDNLTGVCAMIMAEGLDTGDLLSCVETKITENDTAGSLHDRLATMGANLMPETLIDYANKNIKQKQQDDAKATYAKKLTPTEFLIDWATSAKEVSCKVRGFSPFPGARALLNGKKITLLFAKQTTDLTKKGEPGEILSVTRDGIEVACGEGSVLITELKPEGKGKMPAHSFTLGTKVSLGDRFQ